MKLATRVLGCRRRGLCTLSPSVLERAETGGCGDCRSPSERPERTNTASLAQEPCCLTCHHWGEMHLLSVLIGMKAMKTQRRLDMKATHAQKALVAKATQSQYSMAVHQACPWPPHASLLARCTPGTHVASVGWFSMRRTEIAR